MKRSLKTENSKTPFEVKFPVCQSLREPWNIIDANEQVVCHVDKAGLVPGIVEALNSYYKEE